MATNARVRLVVVGGGVIGCAVLYEFARRGVTGILLEAQPDICEGTSKANSAILHTGFDSNAGTVESRMLRRSAELWPQVLDALAVPHLAVGALMLARTHDEATRLRTEISANAETLGVRIEILDAGEVRAVAPYVVDDVVAALSIPDEAVVDPFWLTRAYAEAAISAGSEVRLESEVTGLELEDEGVVVRLADGTAMLADQVVDAAGLWADDVAALAGDTSFQISPRKGQFLVSEETFGVERIVLPIPGPMGKGVLVTPIVFGGLLLGPTAVDGNDKMDRGVDTADGERILRACRAMVPALADAAAVRQFAGLRHVSSTGDFVVRPSSLSNRLYLAAGIRSTGISTSPAVAEAIVNDVVTLRRWRTAKRRRVVAPPAELPERAGEVICLCRSISRGEIEAASRRPIPAGTLDGIKRRAGAMFGDCQGNLCALEVGRIIAAERAVPIDAVLKHRRGSWMWETMDGAALRTGDAEGAGRRPVAEAWDAIVVGAGHAGAAAAESLRSHGRSVLAIERRSSHDPALQDGTAGLHDDTAVPPRADRMFETTVVGLSPEDDGWSVLAQTADEAVAVRARVVAVATGAYVEPREHRAIAGPRPAGVITGDLCRHMLDAGLVPGRRVVLVGTAARTAQLGGRLQAIGADVIALASTPDEVRGEGRLEGVRVEDDWLAVDTLVLDDRLLSQAILLRALGLVDGRPGTPPPDDGEGRLPLPGLWAAGCCIRPDADHETCARVGHAVGTRIALALEREDTRDSRLPSSVVGG